MVGPHVGGATVAALKPAPTLRRSERLREETSPALDGAGREESRGGGLSGTCRSGMLRQQQRRVPRPRTGPSGRDSAGADAAGSNSGRAAATPSTRRSRSELRNLTGGIARLGGSPARIVEDVLSVEVERVPGALLRPLGRFAGRLSLHGDDAGDP